MTLLLFASLLLLLMLLPLLMLAPPPTALLGSVAATPALLLPIATASVVCAAAPVLLLIPSLPPPVSLLLRRTLALLKLVLPKLSALLLYRLLLLLRCQGEQEAAGADAARDIAVGGVAGSSTSPAAVAAVLPDFLMPIPGRLVDKASIVSLSWLLLLRGLMALVSWKAVAAMALLSVLLSSWLVDSRFTPATLGLLPPVDVLLPIVLRGGTAAAAATLVHSVEPCLLVLAAPVPVLKLLWILSGAALSSSVIVPASAMGALQLLVADGCAAASHSVIVLASAAVR